MNEKKRRLVAAVGLCFLLTAGLVSIAADVHACPANEVEDYYYSDGTYTDLVGYRILQCNCWGRWGWGSTTNYRLRYQTPCND